MTDNKMQYNIINFSFVEWCLYTKYLTLCLVLNLQLNG